MYYTLKIIRLLKLQATAGTRTKQANEVQVNNHVGFETLYTVRAFIFKAGTESKTLL